MSESHVVVAQGPINYIKELISRCERVGIEVSLDQCRAKSWGTKLELLVKEQDVPQYAEMMRDDWMKSLHQEGAIETDGTAKPISPGSDGEPPCPACGTAAPLVDGCCIDCGLHLE